MLLPIQRGERRSSTSKDQSVRNFVNFFLLLFCGWGKKYIRILEEKLSEFIKVENKQIAM
jgi:hypothetical protein